MMGLLVFDLDGTLIDSLQNYTDAFVSLVRPFGVSEAAARQLYHGTTGQPLDEQLRAAVGDAVDSPPLTLVHRFWEIVEATEATVLPGVRRTLARLWHAGYKLALSTGSPPDLAVRRLSQAQVLRYFDLVLGTDYQDGGLRKGQAHIVALRQKFNLSDSVLRANTMFIGDGALDMSLARSAGIYAVGKLGLLAGDVLVSAGASLLIANVEELEQLLLTREGDWRTVSGVIADSGSDLTAADQAL